MGEEREKERNFVGGVDAAVGDCRHHHRHHRSVYKKNFFCHHLLCGEWDQYKITRNALSMEVLAIRGEAHQCLCKQTVPW